jgi:hypothetical protein
MKPRMGVLFDPSTYRISWLMQAKWVSWAADAAFSLRLASSRLALAIDRALVRSATFSSSVLISREFS